MPSETHSRCCATAARRTCRPPIVSLVATILVAAACGGGGERGVGPGGDNGGGPDTTGQVQRATLSLAIELTSADSAVARMLGWTDARVRLADISLQREGASSSITARTNAQGRVDFTDLIPGRYRITALRTLTAQERGQLSGDLAEVSVIGGGGELQVDAPTTSRTVTASVSRRGSLVVSEYFFPWRQPDGATWYLFGGYLELYNNTDSTIYLDGKIIGHGWDYSRDYSTETCAMNERFRNDPSGVWVYDAYRFPGSGRDHAISPGQAIVVATDAVDHRSIDPEGHDLRAADFEFLGTSDVDNPAVPNMIHLGPRQPLRGHGLFYYSDVGLPLVVENLDYSVLDRAVTDYHATPLVRIPAAAILDNATFMSTYVSPTSPWCAQVVHRNFESQPAVLMSFYSADAFHRLPLGGGVLQRTRTSARDFVARKGTPGIAP